MAHEPPDIQQVVVDVHIDMAELTVRMIEAQTGSPRPVPLAGQALHYLPPELREAWIRAAQAAVAYMTEALEGTRHEGRLN